MTVIVNTHSEEQEKALLAFLDSLQYDYQMDEDQNNYDLSIEQQQELIRREEALKAGTITSRPWSAVKKDFEKRIYR